MIKPKLKPTKISKNKGLSISKLKKLNNDELIDVIHEQEEVIKYWNKKTINWTAKTFKWIKRSKQYRSKLEFQYLYNKAMFVCVIILFIFVQMVLNSI